MLPLLCALMACLARHAQSAHGPEYEGEIGYTSMTRVSEGYKIYHNMWMHNTRWYMLLPPNEVSNPDLEEGMSTNTAALRTPVQDLKKFTENLEIAHFPGNSLIVDFPFQAIHNNLGHWLEIMVPTFRVLYEEEWLNHTKGESKNVDYVLFPNLSKFHFSSFFSSILAIALSPGTAEKAPPNLVDWSEIDRLGKLGWIWVENLLVVQDRYTHPQRKIGFPGPDHGDLWRYDGCDRWISPTFAPAFGNQAQAMDFRDAALLGEDFEAPKEWAPGTPAPPIPKRITFLINGEEDSSKVDNPSEVMSMLEEVAEHFGMEAHMTKLTPSAPFASHLDVMVNTGVLVAKQTPLLAASVFLPPGAAVYELLPYKWEWHNMSALFYNITSSMKDIHHYAWRPMSDDFCVYKDPVGKRYRDWFPSECHAKECLQVFAAADLIVDVEPVRELLMRTLPGILAGKSVEEMREPWPIPV